MGEGKSIRLLAAHPPESSGKAKEKRMAYPESITSPIDPESHHVPDGVANDGIVPVQIGLFLDVEVEIVFLCPWVELPCRTCVFCSVSNQGPTGTFHRRWAASAPFVRPCRTRRSSSLTLKDGLPIVRREPLTVDVSRGAPKVPIALGIVLGRLGLLEPFVLCRTQITSASGANIRSTVRCTWGQG